MLRSILARWSIVVALLLVFAGALGFYLSRQPRPEPATNPSRKSPMATPAATELTTIVTPSPGTAAATARTSTPEPRTAATAEAAPAGTPSAQSAPGTPTVVSAAPPTVQEAEQVVRAYFAGVEADSFDAVRATTAGNARRRTDALIAELQQQEREQDVDVDLRVLELTTSPAPTEGSTQPIRVSSLIGAYVDTGFATVKVREIRSNTVFKVARVAGGTKIVDIEGALGS